MGILPMFGRQHGRDARATQHSASGMGILPMSAGHHGRDARATGHSADFKFAISLLIERPTCLLQQKIDERVARLGLGVIVRVGLSGVGLFRFGYFGAETPQLGVECVFFDEDRDQFFITLAELLLEPLQLLDSLFWQRRGFRQRAGIEGEIQRRFRPTRVGVGQPVTDVKQFLHRRRAIGWSDGPIVHRAVAEGDEYPCLVEYRLAYDLLKRRLVDERAQVVLVG